MPVKELREKLNLQNKYENFYDFRKRVLKQAQKDVEAHTNMSFQWKEIKAKKGRKIERLIFDIEVTDPEQVEIDFDDSTNVSTVDMNKYRTLQKHLREICEFSGPSV
jgi:plasmid replication initiation protein